MSSVFVRDRCFHCYPWSNAPWLDGDRFCAAPKGSRAVNCVPFSRVEITDIRPSWARTICEHVCRPNPSPLRAVEVE